MPDATTTLKPLVTLIAITFSLTACSGTDPENQNPTSTGAIQQLTVTANPSNALSYYVEWTTTEPTTTRLTVTCGDNWEQTYTSQSADTDHRVFTMGLWDGADCTARATAQLDSGESDTASTDFQAGPLPDFLPELTVHTRDASRIQPGWTMMNLTNGFDGVPYTAVMVDNRGRYRWYHQRSTSHEGSDTEAVPMSDGVLIAGDRGRFGPKKIDWAGNTIWSYDFSMHHDIRLSEDGSSLWYLGYQPGDACPQSVRSASLEKFSRDQETTDGIWALCDYWFPDNLVHGGDWSHLNTIEPVPDENQTFILSSRNQHTLFKFDAADDQIDWRLGGKGEFGLDRDNLFLRQHDPAILPNGNILMFDNGDPARGDDADEFDREWSRAVEIAYDTDTMTAEVVWEFRPDPDIFARIWGDADRLDNGNTLVTFGLRNTNNARNSRLMEATPASEKVWDLEAPNKWGWYRADRLPDPPTGHTL